MMQKPHMELYEGSQVTLGNFKMETEQSIPSWIEESLLPKAHESIKPLLDIYSQILRLQDSQSLILSKITEIQAILLILNQPWYTRLWNWFKGA